MSGTDRHHRCRGLSRHRSSLVDPAAADAETVRAFP
jgi:hypothetical protein